MGFILVVCTLNFFLALYALHRTIPERNKEYTPEPPPVPFKKVDASKLEVHFEDPYAEALETNAKIYDLMRNKK